MKNKLQEYKAGFPGIVYAGTGSLQKVEGIVRENQAERVTVIIDKAVLGHDEVKEMFQRLDGKLAGVVDDVPSEPSSHCIRRIYDKVMGFRGDIIVAIGGGSVMDMAKVVACAIKNREYVDAGFMDAKYITHRPVPTIMVPTTAGTGAEATPNAIFLVPEKELKVGVISNFFVASYVILDPLLTVGLPPALTASTGIDALCHAVETYISTLSNPISQTFSLRAVELIGGSIEAAYHDGGNIQARENMLLGSFFAGLCLFSSSTVAVHALSYPLGGKYHIPHGVANAILLPWVLKENLPVCREAYERLAEIMIPREKLEEMKDIPEGFVEYIFSLCEKLGIPQKLTGYGICGEDIDYLTDNAMEVKRLLGRNPRELTREEIGSIYRTLL